MDYYKALFKNAFGDEKVTRERIAEAMSQFLNSMVTAESTFDSANPGGWGVGNSLVFNESEQRGMEIFFNQGRCANCHNPSGDFAFFMQEDFADIGLEANPVDKGLGANQQGMDGMFKIPSLRNVALTAPFMHDGRFKTLEEVVDHYNEGVQASPNLNWSLQGSDSQPLRMGLNTEQKQDLVAFLHTLTDTHFTKDEKFSNPFTQ
jgi:cytochrome c peroxidase